MNAFLYRDIKIFPGLNGMRFIAAYLVILQHAEDIRKKYHLPNFERFSICNAGGLAVSIFFVLSGFLITFLLLKEFNTNEEKGIRPPVSIRNFYVRRILRIWPLYFLVVWIGTVGFPFLLNTFFYHYHAPFTLVQVWPYYLFFMPFMVNFFYGHNLLEPLWSIGVEEIFYLFWAPMARYCGQLRYFPRLLIGILIVKAVLSLWLNYGLEDHKIAAQFDQLQFEAMAIGSLGAYWVFHRTAPISTSFWFSPLIQVICLGFLALRFFFHYSLMSSAIGPYYGFVFDDAPVAGWLVYALYLWLILNIALNENHIFGFQSKLLQQLGDISYGVYMYHMIILVLFFASFKQQMTHLGWLSGTLFFYSLITVSVVGLSYLSKRYFENFFLNLKDRWL